MTMPTCMHTTQVDVACVAVRHAGADDYSGELQISVLCNRCNTRAYYVLTRLGLMLHAPLSPASARIEPQHVGASATGGHLLFGMQTLASASRDAVREEGDLNAPL